MEAPFPGGLSSLDFSETGVVAVLDETGRRLGIGAAVHDLDFAASCCRFHGENIALMGSGRLRTLRADGSMIGEMHVPPEAADLALLPGGSVLVGTGRTLHRLGDAQVSHEERGLKKIRAIAVESGGVWVAGSERRAVRLRPVEGGYVVRDFLELPGEPCAAAIGPDGELYLVLEPGDRIVRGVEEPRALPAVVTELARSGRGLWGCGPAGLVDLSALVPAPDGEGPAFDLPSCS